MDRISGILPQVGWSPAMAPVTAERAPATTVEAISQSSSADSGMDANVDTQTGGSRAEQISALMRSNGMTAEATVLANSQVVALDQPSGPPPTFDVSPLEAKAAELSSPEYATAAADEAGNVAIATTDVKSQGKQDASPAPTGDDSATGAVQTEWQTLDTAAQGQSLDLLR